MADIQASFAKRLLSGRSAVIGVPYGWLLLFFLLPFLILVKISVSEMENVVFRDLITYKDGLLQLQLKLSHAQRDALVDDARGDRLDAVLCLLQAAWAQRRHEEGDALYGLPPGLDGLEGWIVTA